MAASNGSRGTEAAAQNGLNFKEGETLFSANAKKVPKECFNRKILVAAHEKGRLETEQELQRNGKQKSEKPCVSGSVESSKLSPPIRLKSQPFSSLKETFLPQLEIDKRHHGRVLFGTLCVRPFKMAPSVIMSVLADKSGKAVSLAILNLPFSLSGQETEARFPPGQKAAIKEPYFKVCTDGKVLIRVENPADFVFVDDANKEILRIDSISAEDELEGVLQELDDIRAEGNKWFAQRKWKEAIDQYRRCITWASSFLEEDEENEKINQRLLLAYSNCSEVWLQMKDFKHALDDAKKALELDSNHQKSISRRDRALKGLGKVPQPANKLKVSAEDTNAADKGLASKIMPKDVTKPAPTASKGKTTAQSNSPSAGVSEGNGKNSKSVSRSPTPESASADLKKQSVASSVTLTKPKDTESKNLALDALAKSASSTSKVKAATEKSVSPPPSKAKDTESKNLTLDALATSASSTSKVKAATEKCVSPPPPKASKVKRIRTRDNSSGTSVTPTKGKKLSNGNADHPRTNTDQPRGNADPPSSAKGKLAASSNRSKKAAAAVDSGRKSADSDSDSDSDSPTTESSSMKRADADDGVEDYTVIARNAARDDSSLPPGFSDSKSSRYSTTEPQKEMAAALGTGGAVGPAIDTELPSFAVWLDSLRSSADVILSQGNWSEAVKLYNRVTAFALPQRNREKVIQTLLLAYSHRSEAWIWIGDFEKSLRDADSAIKIVDNYPKSVVGYEGKHLLNEIRRGRAFHGLGEYEKACLIFHEALKKSPNDKSVNDLLSKSRVALGQSQNGIYDLDEWFINRCRGPPPPCSDFVGPVEIRRVLGKGRGLFVTKDVQAGDLLLVSNPLLVVRRKLNTDDEEDYTHLTSKWRRSGPGAEPVGLYDFVKRLARLRTDKEIYQLYALTGGNPEDETEIPDMSLFTPGTQHVKPGFDSLKISDDEPQKLQRISRIVIRNAMEDGLNPLNGSNQPDEKDEAICVGLWALPSFLNHSCVPNCHMIDIGDTMFVRASRNIHEGEELTRAYFDVYQNGIDRHKVCAEWNFVCNCERCILERSLTDQRILLAHEYRALLERAREESLKRQQFAGREKSLSILLPNPQPALLQLRKFADWCDRLLDQAEGLGNMEKAWIGASHLEAYISRFQGSKDRNQFILGLENILEFMTNTAILAIGHTTGSALERAAVLLEQVEKMYGRSSQTYRRIETRVLDLYHTTFGGSSKEILFTMSRLMISK